MGVEQEKDIDKKYQTTQRKLKEMAILSEKIERGYKNILSEISMSKEELEDYMENPHNFPPEVWEEIVIEKQKVDEMLKLQMATVVDIKKNTQKYSEKGRIKEHWLFVR